MGVIPDLGFFIPELSLQGIKNAIDDLNNKSDNELYELSLKNIEEINKSHSLDSFKNRMEQILAKVLN